MKKQIKLLILAPLLFCAPAFGDEGNFKPKKDIPASPMPAIYNYPAQVDTKNGWDTFVTASFLYWNVFQEGMEMGSFRSIDISDNSPTGILEFPDEYKAGFKVGFGWNTPFDDWTLSAEYTWFHHKLHQTQPKDLVLTPNFYSFNITNGFHKWMIDLDMVDIVLSRSFYQGKNLILIPSFGLKGVFLDQKYTVKGISQNVSTSFFGQERSGYGKTASWAVGPSLGLEGRFLLGKGFRLEGALSGALTFTRYNGFRYFSQSDSTEYPDANIRGSDENRVRAIGDAEAGFGWGMYLCNQRYHIDFSATYEFQVFWNQNMMSWFANRVTNASKSTTNASSPGNLYFQGLTVSGTFDF